jgi:hypothetical protein
MSFNINEHLRDSKKCVKEKTVMISKEYTCNIHGRCTTQMETLVCLKLQRGSEKVHSRRLALPFISRLAHCIEVHLDKRRSTLHPKPETPAIASFRRALLITCSLPLSSRYTHDFVPTANRRKNRRGREWKLHRQCTAEDVGLNRSELMTVSTEVAWDTGHWHWMSELRRKGGGIWSLSLKIWNALATTTESFKQNRSRILSNCVVKLPYLTMMHRFPFLQHNSNIRTWAFYSKTCLYRQTKGAK